MIKKLFIVLCAILLLSSPAMAISLVCDPPAPEEAVTSYKIYQDGVLLATPNAEADGSVKYDISHLTPGRYTFTAEACNIWGCGPGSNPTLSPAGVSAPLGLTLTVD